MGVLPVRSRECSGAELLAPSVDTMRLRSLCLVPAQPPGSCSGARVLGIPPRQQSAGELPRGRCSPGVFPGISRFCRGADLGNCSGKVCCAFLVLSNVSMLCTCIFVYTYA